MIVSARIVRLALAVTFTFVWLVTAPDLALPQSPVVVQETWSHPTQVGTEWETLMVAAILSNDSEDLVQIRRIRVTLKAEERVVTVADASACTAKTVLVPGERTACYTEIATSESEAVDGLRFSLTAVEATAKDLARFAQPPVLVREVLHHGEDYTRYDAELLNPGPASYRSFGDSWSGALQAIVVFRAQGDIVQVNASPLSMRLGHVPVGERLHLSSIGFPRAVAQVEEVEVFYGMRPLPEGKAPIDWEVADLAWSVDEAEEGEVLSISSMITNRSEIEAEVAVTAHLLEAEGSSFLSMAYSTTPVAPGASLPFTYTSRVRETGTFDVVAEVRVQASSMEMVDLPSPPSPTPAPTPFATVTAPSPTERLHLPILSPRP